METVLQSAFAPLVAGFAYLLIAGYHELKTYRVPNLLTFASLGLALTFALVAGFLAPERAGSIASALIGMVLGGVLLLPLYVKGVLGAGCVKTQAACGAWIGAGFSSATCIKLVVISTLLAALIAGICWIIVYAKRKQENQPTTYAVSNLANVSTLMHGQLPLSIGTMVGLVVASLF